MRFILALLLLAAETGPGAVGGRFDVEGAPVLLEPGIVSTDRSEIKVTFSPDGKRMLWGTIGWTGGVGGWDIWESVKDGGGWGQPHAAAFNSPENDFDPSFAPDGRGLYFFSNRPGGLGGDDIYFVAFDPDSGAYGRPVNAGPKINSAGDEWGPVVSPEGTRLLVSTNGRGGVGKHDLFVSRKDTGEWAELTNLGSDVNSPLEDFDAAFADDDGTVVFASGDLENGPVTLRVSFSTKAGYSTPMPLPPAVTSPTFMNFGVATSPSEPGVLYFTSNFEGNAKGRSDIYAVRYRITRPQ